MMGKNPTPPQLVLRQSEHGSENMYEGHQQLRRQGIPLPVIQKFERVVYENRTPGSGQVAPFVAGADAIGAELHWI